MLILVVYGITVGAGGSSFCFDNVVVVLVLVAFFMMVT